MEFQRIILLIALVIVSLLLWNAWQTENLPSKKIEKVAPSGIPESPISTLPQEIKPPSSNFPPSTPLPTNVPSDRIVTVSTDVLQINIDKLGGNITYAAYQNFLNLWIHPIFLWFFFQMIQINTMSLKLL